MFKAVITQFEFWNQILPIMYVICACLIVIAICSIGILIYFKKLHDKLEWWNSKGIPTREKNEP